MWVASRAREIQGPDVLGAQTYDFAVEKGPTRSHIWAEVLEAMVWWSRWTLAHNEKGPLAPREGVRREGSLFFNAQRR